MTVNGKHGSVQEMLPLEEIVEGVLCLRGGDYRAIIQAQSVNFALKSEEEQEAVMAAYRSFLNSLSHPVQMLVRILPTNVEPYLAGFRTNVTAHANSEAIRRLALDLRPAVSKTAAVRIDRRLDGESSGSGASLMAEYARARPMMATISWRIVSPAKALSSMLRWVGTSWRCTGISSSVFEERVLVVVPSAFQDPGRSVARPGLLFQVRSDCR